VGDLLSNNGEGSTCGDSDPSNDVSFAHDIRPLLSESCDCHQRLATAGLSTASYEALRRGGTSSGTSMIVAGKPCESVFFEKLEPTPPFGARMPLNKNPFTHEELQLVSDWIAEGALNN
jgi:hypothetical protein